MQQEGMEMVQAAVPLEIDAMLLTRLLSWANAEVENPNDLHVMAGRAVQLYQQYGSALTAEDFPTLVGEMAPEPGMEQGMEGEEEVEGEEGAQPVPGQEGDEQMAPEQGEAPKPGEKKKPPFGKKKKKPGEKPEAGEEEPKQEEVKEAAETYSDAASHSFMSRIVKAAQEHAGR
jgi:outer membrane biosynthesis protein TonB